MEEYDAALIDLYTSLKASSGTEVEPHQKTLLDGGLVDDPSYIDSYVWVVKTSDSLPACSE